METGHPSTRAVNSGSGNRALFIVSNDGDAPGYTGDEIAKHDLMI